MRCKEASLLLEQGAEFATTRMPPLLTRPAMRDGAYPHLLARRLFGAHDTSNPHWTSTFRRHNGRVLHHRVDQDAGVNVDHGKDRPLESIVRPFPRQSRVFPVYDWGEGSGSKRLVCRNRAAGRFSAPRGETLLLLPPRHS